MASTRPADPMLSYLSTSYVNDVLKGRLILKKISCHSGRGTGVCNNGKKLWSLPFIPPNNSRLLPPSSPLPVWLRLGEQEACGHSAWSERDQERRVQGRRVGEGKREEEGEKSSSKSGPASRVRREGKSGEEQISTRQLLLLIVLRRQTGFGMMSKMEGASKQ